MQHRIGNPILFELLDSKPFEKLFLTEEIGFKGGDKQAFAETAGTAQEIGFSPRDKFIDKCCFIYIYIPTSPYVFCMPIGIFLTAVFIRLLPVR